MIKKVDDFKGLSGVFSPLLPILYSAFSFPLHSSDGVYTQTDDNGSALCFFSVEGSGATVILSGDEPDYSELQAFFQFSGIRYVTADKPLNMAFKVLSDYSLLKFEGDSSNIDGDCRFLTPESSLLDYSELSSVSLCAVDGFGEWYSIFSRKINYGLAEACFIVKNEVFVSFAVAPYIYGGCAVVSGVETDYPERRKGYGTRCVSSLVGKLLNASVDSIFLWCENKNISFYRKLGFAEQGKIYVGECF